MPKIEITSQEIKNYYSKKELRHIFYQRSCLLAEAIKVHANGIFPEALLANRRPNEPLEVKEYRKTIFVEVTKPAFTKVFSSLQKIRRSGDWNIDYDEVDTSQFPAITEEESLYKYCEEEFPYFTSVTNWLFNLELRKYLIDANAVVLVTPLQPVTDPTTYPKPFPLIFDSELVIDYKEEDWCLLKNPLGATYISDRTTKNGDSYYFVNTLTIQRWDQVDGKGNFQLKAETRHELGFMPVRKLGGIYTDQAGDEFLLESRISGMLPELNEALREYSDLQASVVLHIYPERWRYTNSECPTCNGKTKVVNPAFYDGCDECGPQYITCSDCHGTGIYRNKGPYEDTILRPNNGAVGENGNIPNPPGGFFEKDVEIVKLQDTRVQDHIYRAYAAINFEFLADTPMNQSGTAKEVDKDELNNTVNSFAEDIVATMDFVYRCVAAYRYKFKYPDTWEGVLPKIAVPVNYDLLSNSNAQAALSAAKAANVNPVILNALEAEYASKVFYSNPDVKEQLLLEITLDPLPNITESDKILRLTNKGIDQMTYVISSNIHAFIQRAQMENPDFVKMDEDEQREVLEEYAQEIIDAQNAKNKLTKVVNMSGNGVEYVAPDGSVTPAPEDDPNFNNSPDNQIITSQQTANGVPRYSAAN